MSDLINSLVVRMYLSLKREDGQAFIEYALIGVLVAVAVAATVTALEGNLAGALNQIGGKL